MLKTRNLIQFVENTNPWWQKSSFRFDTTSREYYLHDITKKRNRLIRLFIGARRVGKTFLLFSTINTLLTEDITPKTIIFLNSDLREIQEVGIKATLEEISKLHGYDLYRKKLFVFIDEIQELKEWEKELKLLYDSTNIQFFISGSSASLLTKKASKLTGRFELIRVLPLSLKEYITFNKIKVKGDTSKRNILHDYLLRGGYPERIKSSIPGYLKEIVDSTIYRDLLEEYGIRTPTVLEDILKLLADKITNPITPNRIAKDLKIDNSTAANYLKYMQAVYIIYPLYRHSGSNRIALNFPPKYYFNDTGILNELSIRPRIGHLAENAVFLEFLRRQNRLENYQLYYEVINGQEYDFSDVKNIYEVKYILRGDKRMNSISNYELTGRLANLLPNPIMLGNRSIKTEIINNGYELDFQLLFDFLMGN